MRFATFCGTIIFVLLILTCGCSTSLTEPVMGEWQQKSMGRFVSIYLTFHGNGTVIQCSASSCTDGTWSRQANGNYTIIMNQVFPEGTKELETIGYFDKDSNNDEVFRIYVPDYGYTYTFYKT